jgi:hypothetical protein
METKITESTSPNYNGPTDPDNDFMCATQLQRIADSLAEILKLVKQDQEKFERYKEETTEKWEPGLCK